MANGYEEKKSNKYKGHLFRHVSSRCMEKYLDETYQYAIFSSLQHKFENSFLRVSKTQPCRVNCELPLAFGKYVFSWIHIYKNTDSLLYFCFPAMTSAYLSLFVQLYRVQLYCMEKPLLDRSYLCGAWAVMCPGLTLLMSCLFSKSTTRTGSRLTQQWPWKYSCLLSHSCQHVVI